MIKTSFIQFKPSFGNVNKTINKLELLFQKVKESDIIVLPELAATGYNFMDYKEAYANSETIEKGIFTEYIVAKAKKFNSYIISGINERDGDKLYNTAIIAGPKGYIGKYRKLHLFMNEKNIFTKGDIGLQLFDLGFARTGILICFDWMFPEVWRQLALKGADIICHPSNLVLTYAQQAVPVHCIINRIFAITCNRIGEEKGLKFTGGSIISGTKGEIIYKASKSKTETPVCQINIDEAKNKMITKMNNVFEDRRIDVY